MANACWFSRSSPAVPLIVACAGLLAFTLALAPADAAGEPDSKPQDAPPAAKKSAAEPTLDETLLKDLDNELLEGAGDAKDSRRSKRPAGDKSSEQPLDQSVIDGEDIGMPSPEEDPLSYISQEMRSAESLITDRAQRAHAEHLQQRIVEDLAKLIEQAQQQRAAQQAASTKNKKQQTSKRQQVQQSKPSAGKSGKDSNKPAQDSTDRLGKAEDARPDPELVKGLLKDAWGHLPQRAREQMLQNSPERFLPQYELMIERYYKRLAEEQNRK
jgi:DNA-binding protein H-NS